MAEDMDKFKIRNLLKDVEYSFEKIPKILKFFQNLKIYSNLLN